MSKEKSVKIKITRPTVAGGKIVAKGAVLTMLESESKHYIRTGKAVVAGAQTKEESDDDKDKK